MLLAIASGAIAFTWPAIRFLIVSKQDQPFVDLAYRRAASPSAGARDPRSEAEWRANRYPIVRHRQGEVCVELRPEQPLNGYYEACFDAHTRKPGQETIIAY